MKRMIGVYLGDSGKPVGTLRFDMQGARQSAGFQYHPEWLASEHRFAIDPNLPLVAGMQFHKKVSDGSVFPAAIADTEPDGWARRVILRDHSKRRQEMRAAHENLVDAPLTPIDFLLAVDDANRVGALRFQDEEGVFQRASEPNRRTAPPLIELGALLSASRAVETNTETAADLAYLRGRGTSLGGLRPKCSVVDVNGVLSIAKFPSVQDDRAVTKGEVLALHLAQGAGIKAAEARLIESDGMPIALIRRFDRSPEGRLMYISAASLLGADSSAEHTYTELADGLRQHGSDAKSDIEELWRRIAFFILINNVDDHLHNHGFLHVAHGQWRLAPAFDVNPFPDRAREMKTWISEDAGPAASIEALISAARYFRINPDASVRILIEVERAVSKWREIGREIGMSDRELDQYADAFEHRERGVVKRLA
jgi:serine/threonine-protein kinase HipA